MNPLEAFAAAFNTIVGVEGRYCNDPADSGGETMYGIRATVARAYGYTGPMRDMSLDVARFIYRRQYWDVMQLNAIADLSARIAHELFDIGVNCGVEVAGRYLQRALRVLADATLKVDGIIGAVTLTALRAYLLQRRDEQGEDVLLRALNAQQAIHYIELAEARVKDRRFVYGWIRQRVSM